MTFPLDEDNIPQLPAEVTGEAFAPLTPVPVDAALAAQNASPHSLSLLLFKSSKCSPAGMAQTRTGITAYLQKHLVSKEYLRELCSDPSAVHKGYFSIDKGPATVSTVKRGSEFSPTIFPSMI